MDHKLVFKDFNDFKLYEGKDLPVGEWLLVTQEMIDAFAEATQDFQWIHVNAEKASKHSPFKKTIAHGFLSVSLLSKLLTDIVKIESVVMGVNYGLNTVRFPHPVPVDSSVRLLGSIQKIETYAEKGLKVTWNCTITIKNVEKPACVAEFVSLMFEE